MSCEDPAFLKDVKAVLLKDGRLLCLKCFRKDSSPPRTRKGHLESRIGPMFKQSPLKDIGVIITETDVGTDDFTHLCDKCGEVIT